MKDRVPTQVVNGAVRMAQYNASGTFTGYIYLKRADEPSEPGTPYNKNNVLTDATAAALGLTSDNPTPNDAFARIAARFAEVEPVKNVTQLANTTTSSDDETTTITLPKTINQYSKLYLAVSVESDAGMGFFISDIYIPYRYVCVEIYSNGAIATANYFDDMAYAVKTAVYQLGGMQIETSEIVFDNNRTAADLQIYGVEAAT